MKVADVEGLFVPYADAVLEKGLTLPQAQKALSVVLVRRALEKHGKKQAIVAHFLGISPTVVSRIVRDVYVVTRTRKRQPRDWEKKNGGTPKQVLGQVEL